MDGFEFDIRLTRNRRLVICHDARFNHLSVRRSTLKELQASCPSPDECPTSLPAVVDRYSRTAFLNIEVKVRGVEALVYRLFRGVRPRRGYIISSFLPSVLREFHRIDDSLILGTISHTLWQLGRWHRLPATYVLPKYRLLSRGLVEEIHAAGKLIVTWTVNKPKQMQRAVDLGVDGIISDDTKLLEEVLSRST